MKKEHLECVANLATMQDQEVLAVCEDIHTGEMLVLLDAKGMWCVALTTITAEEFYERKFFTEVDDAFSYFAVQLTGR